MTTVAIFDETGLLCTCPESYAEGARLRGEVLRTDKEGIYTLSPETDEWTLGRGMTPMQARREYLRKKEKDQ